jgi:cytochrome c oxidase assembly protein subunit 23
MSRSLQAGTRYDHKGSLRRLSAPYAASSVLEALADVRQYADPCEAASKASLECLERTHYNREEVCLGRTPHKDKADEQCMEFFRAYRECKGKWVSDPRWLARLAC